MLPIHFFSQVARHQAECAAEDTELLRVVDTTSSVVKETSQYPVEVRRYSGLMEVVLTSKSGGSGAAVDGVHVLEPGRTACTVWAFCSGACMHAGCTVADGAFATVARSTG